MRDLKELRISHDGKRKKKPPQDWVIQSFERRFKVRLPEDYLEFLRFSNGGYPKLCCFRPKGDPEGPLLSAPIFYFLNDRGWNQWENLWRETIVWQPGIGDRAIPIAGNGGGNQIALDFTTEPPRVVYCDHEDEFYATVVADSFAEFLDLLIEDPDLPWYRRYSKLRDAGVDEATAWAAADAYVAAATAATERSRVPGDRVELREPELEPEKE